MTSKNKKKQFTNFPIIEIFGTTFALLVVLFLILNIISENQLQSRLEKTIEEGSYKISWENNASGYIVIAFPSYLFIIENATKVEQTAICAGNSPFRKYVKNIYLNNNKQIIFAIVENGTRSMKIARDCMRTIFPNKKLSIAWIIANEELLKSVSINQMPSYLKKLLK